MLKQFVVIGIFSFFIVASIIILTASSTNEQADHQNSPSFNPHYAITPVPIPDNITFAGEPVPINYFDVYESLDREMLVNTYWQSQTLLFIKKAHRYFPLIEPILKDAGVPDDLKYLAVAESGLANVVSPARAEGFWQFLEGTARDYKLEVNSEVDERYHVEKATLAAATFLKESYQKYGTWTMAAASYNMGRKNISRQIDRQKSGNYFDLVLGEETGRYVYRLIALKLIMENPENYGFYINDKQKYQNIPHTLVEVDTMVSNLADFAHQMGINYKVLKELNPWLRNDKLTNKTGKKYQIKIADTTLRTVVPDTVFYKN
ncbi:MAG: murein transglycosylase [Bacteroidetes bacterium HGW-Bacteroidetes-4]|jgi:hypothetical protein|nr:MAG: murein transglycosylase [Bacteroidetes bacterium HGW-Bacteroidetes-4]